jgi:hypothetical protein
MNKYQLGTPDLTRASFCTLERMYLLVDKVGSYVVSGGKNRRFTYKQLNFDRSFLRLVLKIWQGYVNKEYELCPVSVIGCLLAVKRRADYEDVHAAVGRCDEEEQAGLHEV